MPNSQSNTLEVTTRTAQLRAEALSRATTGQSWTNFPAIMAGFIEKGIPEAEILPRENVLTFNAWKALGRHVKRGEHGVRVTTWIPVAETRDETGAVTRKAGKRPWSAVVFHVSQTEAN
jgi:antirestriction protein ArdC